MLHMQATVVIGLAVYVLFRDYTLKGTPLQTWPGWYNPIPKVACSHAASLHDVHIPFLSVLQRALC